MRPGTHVGGRFPYLVLALLVFGAQLGIDGTHFFQAALEDFLLGEGLCRRGCQNKNRSYRQRDKQSHAESFRVPVATLVSRSAIDVMVYLVSTH